MEAVQSNNSTANSTLTNSTSPPISLPQPLPTKPLIPPPPIVSEIVFEDKIYPKEGKAYQKFGHKVAANANFVAVGASSATSEPKLHLFEGVGDGKYTQKGILSSGSAKYDGFGLSADFDSDFLFVGAPSDDSFGYSSGLVYVYPAGSGSVHEKGAKPAQILQPGVSQKGGLFGQTLSASNDTLVVGAPGSTSLSGKSAGTVYVYFQSNG